MTFVIAEPCIDVKDGARVDKCPAGCTCEGERMLYTHPGECADCGTCEPACPVEAICCEDDLPEQRAQFTAHNASFSGPLGSPGGASKTGPLPYYTDYVTGCVTSRWRHRARTQIVRRQRNRRPGSRRNRATSMTPYPGPRLRAHRSSLPAARPVPPTGR